MRLGGGGGGGEAGREVCVCACRNTALSHIHTDALLVNNPFIKRNLKYKVAGRKFEFTYYL